MNVTYTVNATQVPGLVVYDAAQVLDQPPVPVASHAHVLDTSG
jgi:hypothetical protein